MAPQITPLRRRPVQQRSTVRVQRMLEACAELIDEVGYERVTTTLIAERAGVAVGSLYQFFPDKRAVVQALALRNLDLFLASVTERFEREVFEHWWDAVDLTFDTYVEMHRTVPAFRHLHFGDVIDPQLLDGNQSNNAVLSTKLTTLIAERFEWPTSELIMPITMAIEAADALLRYAFREDCNGDPRILGEAKTLVKGYLCARLGEPTPRAAIVPGQRGEQE